MENPDPHRPLRTDAQLRRVALLDAAAAVFSEQGVNAPLELVIEFKRDVYQMALTELARFLPRTEPRTRFLRANLRHRHEGAATADEAVTTDASASPFTTPDPA